MYWQLRWHGPSLSQEYTMISRETTILNFSSASTYSRPALLLYLFRPLYFCVASLLVAAHFYSLDRLV
jgi:hypothetical protein